MLPILWNKGTFINQLPITTIWCSISNGNTRRIMEEYRRGFRRYRHFIENVKGWDTVYCGYGYDYFVIRCTVDKKFRERWVGIDRLEPIRYIKKLEIE